jgi:hypothetical protein
VLQLFGIVTYEEFGRKGAITSVGHLAGKSVSSMGLDRILFLRDRFTVLSSSFRFADKQNNPDKHDMMKETIISTLCNIAFNISRASMDIADPLSPGNVYGKGRWPTIQFARFVQMGSNLYGLTFPNLISYPSLYANALFYADLTQNGGQYAGKEVTNIDPQVIRKYISDVASGEVDALNFVLYVPPNFDKLLGLNIPNVEITEDPLKICTVSFEDGKEIW